MSLSGSSALARVAMNPDCEIQVAMSLSGRPEDKFFQAVTGEPFQGEFGERQSARRRGSQFEKNLFLPPGDAYLLRQVLGDHFGIDPDAFHVRDMEQEVPGNTQEGRVYRLARTREIMKDYLQASEPPTWPVLIVQPQLLIPTQPGPKPYFFVAPDFLVWWPEKQMFVPGDAKSFVVRDNDVDASDLHRTRLQMGSQVLGLRHECGRFGKADGVLDEGILIFSTPYGLKPSAPRREDLSGALHQIEKALDRFVWHRGRILGMKAGEPYSDLVPDLRPNFQEQCVSTCALADYCRGREGESVMQLGDNARRFLGADADLDRLAGLLSGEITPKDEQESELVEQLRDTIRRVDPGEGAA